MMAIKTQQTVAQLTGWIDGPCGRRPLVWRALFYEGFGLPTTVKTEGAITALVLRRRPSPFLRAVARDGGRTDANTFTAGRLSKPRQVYGKTEGWREGGVRAQNLDASPARSNTALARYGGHSRVPTGADQPESRPCIPDERGAGSSLATTLIHQGKRVGPPVWSKMTSWRGWRTLPSRWNPPTPGY